MSSKMPFSFQVFKDTSGNVLVGGKLYSYAAGSLTPLNTYTDQSGMTHNANPTILDSNGHASIWIPITTGYKFALQDENGNPIWSIDDVFIIENGEITSDQLTKNSIGEDELDTNPVTSEKLMLSSIKTEVMADGFATTEKFAAQAVKIDKLDKNIDLTQLNKMVGSPMRRIGDLTGSQIFLTPQLLWSSPIKLSSPSTLPSSAANDAQWSPDERFLAVAHSSTPFVTIYERSGNILTKLANPATLPTNTCTAVTWSPNGNFLVCSHGNTPFITIYQRQGNTFTKLTNPSGLPAGSSFGCAFSPDGEFLIVTANLSGAKVYQIAGTTFNDITATCGISSGGLGAKVSWSQDSQYVSISNQFSNGIDVYLRSGATFSKITDPITGLVPAGFPTSLSWSPDGQFLAVAMQSSPYLAIYQFSGGSEFDLLSQPLMIPAGQANCVSWSLDGTSLAVGFQGSPYFLVYTRSGTTFTANADPVSLPDGNGIGVSFSNSNRFLALAIDSTPYINIYFTASSYPSRATLWSRGFRYV